MRLVEFGIVLLRWDTDDNHALAYYRELGVKDIIRLA